VHFRKDLRPNAATQPVGLADGLAEADGSCWLATVAATQTEAPRHHQVGGVECSQREDHHGYRWTREPGDALAQQPYPSGSTAQSGRRTGQCHNYVIIGALADPSRAHGEAATPWKERGRIGRGGGIRTPGPLLPKQVTHLYEIC